MFRGQFEHAIDEKGRLSIPAKFREALREEKSLVLTNSDGYLTAYPLTEWRALEDRLRANPRLKRDLRDYLRLVYSTAEDVAMDGQGRILVPQTLRQRAGITRDVVIIGVMDQIEIWDRARWDAKVAAAPSTEELTAKLGELGFLGCRPGGRPGPRGTRGGSDADGRATGSRRWCAPGRRAAGPTSGSGTHPPAADAAVPRGEGGSPRRSGPTRPNRLSLGGEAMHVRWSAQHKVAVIDPQGDLGIRSMVELKQAVGSLLADGCRTVIVECRAVTQLDAMSLGVLLERLCRAREVGGTLCLAGLNEELLRRLNALRVLSLFEIYGSVPAALAALVSAPAEAAAALAA
jgi:MraZ protein